MSTYRETLMARFLKDVPDEDLEDHPNVYSWLTHEADKAARELHEGAGKPGAGLVGLKMLQEGPMSGVAALMFAAEFTAAGAKNYYEMTYETADLGNVVVTIQRVEGLTPAAKLEAAEATLSAAKGRIDELEIHLKEERAANYVLRTALSAANEKLTKPVVLLDKYVRNEKGQYILDGKCEPRIGFALGWNAAITAAGFIVNENATPIFTAHAPAGVIMRPQFEKPLEHCAAARDGECSHKDCPQIRDNEPMATGRHCPIDNWNEE